MRYVFIYFFAALLTAASVSAYCLHSEDCGPQRYCSTDTPGVKHSSTCRKVRENGKKCEKQQACKSQKCFIVGKEKTGVCVAENPTDLPVGARCQYSTNCLQGNYCLDGKCTPIKDGGENCARDEGCTSKICFIAKDTGPHPGKRVCASNPPTNFGLGQRCTSSTQCSQGLYCDQGFCEIAEQGEPHSPCYKNVQCISTCVDRAHQSPVPFTRNVVDPATGTPKTERFDQHTCDATGNLGLDEPCNPPGYGVHTCYAPLYYCQTGDYDDVGNCAPNP